ncbi:MAG: hypothetical protein ABJM44_00095, partial [Marinomonas sp.]
GGSYASDAPMRLMLLLFAPALLSCLLAVTFAFLFRLPLPFPGFSAVAAAGLAALGTLSFIAIMPPRWVWSEAERLRYAFQSQHSLSDAAAQRALDTITTAHARANSLRQSAMAMRDDVAKMIDAVADRIDAAAREIFYAPNQQRALRDVLIRSELIETAAQAHAALRRREHKDTEDVSRQKLLRAVKALDEAFEQTDLLAARGLLAEVDTSSSVAETVLKPRRPLQFNKATDPSS